MTIHWANFGRKTFLEDSLIDMNVPRLIFIVEGDCEQRFINEHLIKYLSYKFPGTSMHAQKITTNRKKHVKGGNIDYPLFKNELQRTAAQGGVLITTFMDFFRLPTDFPGYSLDARMIDHIEDAIRMDCRDVVIPEFFLPYIQKHEFETLLFANYSGFAGIVNEKQQQKILDIVQDKKFSTPEDINGGQETAPSKRLLSIFNYRKVLDSALALKNVDIDTLRGRCPRFDLWVDRLECALGTGHYVVE